MIGSQLSETLWAVVVGAVLAGVFGLGGTALLERGRRIDAREQRKHELDQATEARRQARIEDAYYGLVGNFYRQAAVHTWVKRYGPPTPANSAPIQLPLPEETTDVVTRATIFGSPEVREIIQRWQVAAAADDVDEMQDVLGALMLQVNHELTGSPTLPEGMKPLQSP
jgi:hypothetical protein